MFHSSVHRARRQRARATSFVSVLALAAILNAREAAAQRADDNALAAAEDAFGTSVGNESVGLYGAGSARGFSPTEAGNVRIEGLYFDQKTGLGSQIVRSSTVRVGVTAQAYPFPAPTGIVDYALRLPGDQVVHSAVVGVGPYDQATFDLVSQVPLSGTKLGFVAGASISHDAPREWIADSITWTGGGLLHWAPSDFVNISGFYSRAKTRDQEVRPVIYTNGILPPRFSRSAYFTQEWADMETRDTNFGVVSTVTPASEWTLRAGVFRSRAEVPENHVISYRNTQPDGSAQVDALKDPPTYAGSYSGEVRLSRRFIEGDRAHTVHIAVRARDARRVFGGADVENLGPGFIAVYNPAPEPAFVFGPQRKDIVKQGTAGISYGVKWLGIGEFSAGLQKTHYTRELMPLGGAVLTKSTSTPWLYNATAALTPTKAMVFYAGYTRGLEASNVAPDNAINRGEALPANITRQADAGIRYQFGPTLRAVAGVFEVSKPYLDRDATNLFRPVGRIRNRGVEASISGTPVPALTVVAGAVLIQSRVSGLTVDSGLIGSVTPGVWDRVLNVNVQYGPQSWNGLSLEGDVENRGDYFADRRNTFKVPGETMINVGARYRFDIGEYPANFRVRVENLTNVYNWHVHSSAGGWFHPQARRRYSARLSVDF
jgi:iron complex outermembrane receptor protein